ncbi:Zn-ribbon domain-containing OB-fold protein [Flavisphingomonas formosensis]|uniref:Zn-ribbon domain-containing OB-fold protein n=1 Tax=Flavisphingomonas formosensis TaxID=861534 RepID=UPI0018DFCC11|nr:OB-fold domain-containing protein [Sphingomonas formosensis]
MAYSFLQHKIMGAIEADDEYWRWLEEGEFRLPRCASCQHWTWPAHFRCGRCGSWEFEWTAIAPEGRIFSWTRSWYAFDRVMERKKDVPYITIVTELPAAGGARVMGVLTGDTSNVRIGMAVRGTIQPPSAKTKFYPSVTWEIVR